MSTGYAKKIDDLNRAARTIPEFVLGDLVKLTTGQRAVVVRAGRWHDGTWMYQLRVETTARGGITEWGRNVATVRGSRMLRKLRPAETDNLPSRGRAR